MKQFHFRLERLLRLKESERRQRVTALAEKRRCLDECEEALVAAQRAFDTLRESYISEAGRPTSPAILMMAQYAMTAAQRRITERAEAVGTATGEVEQARDHLIEKSREVDILERLRRKQWEEHTRDENRRDQNQIDAIAVQQYALRSCSRSDSSVDD
ncbi:MAG TPA: flagellar export protein FliJ [Acidobacteriota bacterium]|nr:flagellar export protein FliJ [Acidobacteriota bacterium]